VRIGDIHLDPVTDGVCILEPTEAYPATSPDDWTPHRRWLTHDGRLELALGGFLVRTGDRRILVDAGLGPYERGPFRGGAFLDELRALGLGPSDITDVVLTHLHFDHVGWATQQGAVVFENATYRCHPADWEHFMHEPGAAKKLAPISARLEPLGPETIAPGVDVLHTPGHTPGHVALVVSSGTDRAMLLGDAVHCPVELDEPEWDGLGDVDAALAKRTREALFRELESSGTPAAAAHFPGLRFGRVLRAEGRPGWVF
jgi:glyoxylase-like metal-dependent hydrolase (beta-lactamase superfamily II)